MKRFLTLMLLVTGLTFNYAVLAQDAADTMTEKEIAEAYFEVFKKVYDMDPALNMGIKYVSVDLTNVKAIDKELLAPVFEEFCKEKGLEFLRYTYKELIDNGYGRVEGVGLREAVSIDFSDAVETENKLEINASKYRGGHGAFGASYKLWKENGEWVIEGGVTWES